MEAAAIRDRFALLAGALDERTRRLVAAAEALTLGRGGPSVVARATGVSRRAIQEGMRAAAEIVRRSGRTPAERASWNARYLRLNGPFLAMMVADEGRRPAGVSTSLLSWIYNTVVMTPSYPIYRRLERQGRTVGKAAGEAGRGRGRQVLLGAGLALAGAAAWVVWRRMSH